MNSIPRPVSAAAITAALALPFSLPAAGTLLFTAAFGLIIRADYVQRHRRVRLPRLAVPCIPRTRAPFGREEHRLAA